MSSQLEAAALSPPPSFKQTSRDGQMAWFNHDGRSFCVYTRTHRGQCHAHIYSPLGNGHSVEGQCSNKGRHEFNGLLFCGGHYPPNVVGRDAKREAIRKAKAEKAAARWDALNATQRQKDAALEAIRQIAAGHNDPRGLAQEVLDMTTRPEAAP